MSFAVAKAVAALVKSITTSDTAASAVTSA